MFIRKYKTVNKKTGAVYIKYQLVESYRSDKGPRQRIVMNLGNINLPVSEHRRLAFALTEKLSGQESLLLKDEKIAQAVDCAMRNYQFYKIRAKKEQNKTNFLTIDLQKVETTQCRSLGAELVANNAYNTLGFDAILKQAGLNKKDIQLAKAVILSRLIAPSSELATLKYIKERSSVPEIVSTDLLSLKKDTVYEIADVLLYHKDKIEKALRQKEESLFENPSTLFLYDLTNTYFEGACKGNSIAKRAKSKEKRNDCPLVSLALLVNSLGYPLFSQVYEGNASEPKTLADILDRLEADCKKTLFSILPTIVADRGIATKENIALLRDRGYEYIAVERRWAKENYLQEFSVATESFEVVEKKDTTIYIKKKVTGDMAELLVLSKARKEKEEAMDKLKEKRFLGDVDALKKSIAKGSVVLAAKVQVRIGRILGRYASVSKYYDIETVEGANKKVTGLNIKRKETREIRNVLTGCYVIQTTHKDMDGLKILESYLMLTRVEDAFGSLKTDLGMRPVYHHKADRTKAHLFISVLAYHLLNTIELKLSEKGCANKWSTVRKDLSTHMRTTFIMTDKDGGIHHIRVSSVPEEIHRKIYDLLKIGDPLKKIHHKL